MPTVSKNLSYSSYLIKILFCLFLNILIWYPNLDANWGIIDDHEIQYFLDGSDRLSITNAYNIFTHHPEASRPFQSSRYRPSYYALRLVECVLWGNNPNSWYAFRIFIAAAFSFVFLLFCGTFVPTLTSYLLTVFASTMVFWRDIVPRLGPAETYMTLGLLAFIPSFIALIKSTTPHRYLYYVPLVLGGIISAGSKENMTILVIPLLYLVYLIVKQKRKLLELFLALIPIVFSLFIILAVLIPTISIGRDIYAQDTSLLPRIIKTLTNVNIYLILLSCLALITLLTKENIKSTRPVLYRNTIYTLLIGTIFYLSQVFFYNGDYPQRNRYDFPGQLFWPILATLAFAIIANQKPKLKTKLQAPLIVIIIFFTIHGTQRNIRAAVKNEKSTTKFTKTMNSAKEYIASLKPTYIIIEVSSPADYEPTHSVLRFLKAEIADIKTTIRSRILETPTFSVLDRALKMKLDALSRNGFTPSASFATPSRIITKFNPTYIKPENCISILFGNNKNAYCNAIKEIRW